MRSVFPLLLALLFIAAACDSDSGDGTDLDEFNGSYDATVSGAISQSHDGNAFFGSGTNTSAGNSGFAITMGASAQSTQQPTFIIAGQLARPGTGTYALTNTADNGGIVATYNGGGTNVFISASGTLRITRSTDDRLDGTFEFVGTSPVPGGGQIDVSGSFKAGGATVTQ